MALAMARDHGLDEHTVRILKIAMGRKMLGERPRLITAPRLECRGELGLIDQSILKRKDSEQELTFGVSSHGRRSGTVAGFARPDLNF
jgi:hypothetical protein